MHDSSTQPEPEQLPPDTRTELTPPEATASPPTPPPELEQLLPKAVRYIKAKRGGDLAAIFLVGSATRDALLPHSDVNLIVLVHGAETDTNWSEFYKGSLKSVTSGCPPLRSS